MLHVNDHSDDLFRRAADNYPLNTGKGDWDALVKKMDAPADEEVPAAVIPAKKNFKWMFLLLLLPLGIWLGSNLQKNKPAGKENTGTVKNNSITNIANDLPITQNSNAGNMATAGINKNIVFTRRMGYRSVADPNAFAVSDRIISSDNISYHDPIRHRFDIPARINMQIFTAGLEEDEPTGNEGSASDLAESKQQQSEKKLLKDLVATDSTKDKKDNPVSKTAKQKINKQKNIYAGIFGGPDRSSIKGQRIEQWGWTLGVVGGMNWKKHWQIETGALMTQKYYGTNGENFSRNKLTIPAATKIEYAEGYCRMLEIPLNVQYKFLFRKNSHFFAGTGLSSYIMQKEHYRFDVIRYGNRYPYEASYTETSNYLFAVANLNIGFAHKIGKTFEARIQPYLKVPMTNVGIGSLPIKSSGVLVGITKTIF